MSVAAVYAGDRRRAGTLALTLLAPSLIVASLMSVSIGPAGIPIPELLRAAWYWITGLGTEPSAGTEAVLLSIRLPRMAMGIAVGFLLAMAGAILQGLFRNPLADPGLIGIASGAALGAVISIVLGGGVLATLAVPFGDFRLPIFAFFGALVVTLILYRVSTQGGRTSVPTMLLAGVALAAFASALIGLFMFMSNDQQLRDIDFWMLGSLSGSTWTKLAALAPFVLIAAFVSALIAPGLNAITLGELEARHLGVAVQSLKRLSIVAVAAAVGAAVAFTGAIAFVGLIIPQLLRMLIGPDHRYLLPASGLAGAILILLADIFCRMIVAPAEVPIGIVMTILGGPFFLWLLLHRRALAED